MDSPRVISCAMYLTQISVVVYLVACAPPKLAEAPRPSPVKDAVVSGQEWSQNSRCKFRPDSSTFWVLSGGTFGLFYPCLGENLIVRIRSDGVPSDEQLFMIYPILQDPGDLELIGPPGWLQTVKVGAYWHVLLKPPVKRYGKTTLVIRRKGVPEGVFGMQLVATDWTGRVTVAPEAGK